MTTEAGEYYCHRVVFISRKGIIFAPVNCMGAFNYHNFMRRILLSLLCMVSLSAYAQHTVVVNPDGTHSVVINNGNTSTIVNPNGTHSTAIHNGNTTTIVNPDGTHSTAVQNGNISIIVNPNGTHSTAIHNGNTTTIVNPDGAHSIAVHNGTNTVITNNGNEATKDKPKWKIKRASKSKDKK